MIRRMKKIRVLGIIPARGGSKGIPHKNIVLLDGKPLIWYTIQAAKRARLLDAFIVSTDDPMISRIAKRYGAEVPFLRPIELAGDRSPDSEFMLHAIDWVEKNWKCKPEMLVNLRPTSPLRTPGDIDAAITAAMKSGATLVKTVSQISSHNPFKMWRPIKDSDAHVELEPLIRTRLYKKHGTDVPRQSLPPVLWQNGLVDVLRVSALKEGGGALFTKVCGVITMPWQSVDLDSMDDLDAAQRMLKLRRKSVSINKNKRIK